MSKSEKSFLSNPKILGALFLGFVIVIGTGLLLGFEVGATNQATVTTGPYHLNLVETMANKENGTTDPMASYFIVTNQGLVHPYTITVPAHRLIEMTITSYDMGNLTVSPSLLKVNGTINDQITIINGTQAMGNDYSTPWATNVTAVPAGAILHTFTVTKLNLNIPVEAGTTEIAYFIINQTGTFRWQCFAPCGTGSSGWGETMSDAGWMSGTLVVT